MKTTKNLVVSSILVLTALAFYATSAKAEVSSEPSPTPETSSVTQTSNTGRGIFNFNREKERNVDNSIKDTDQTPEPKETPRIKGEDRLENLRLRECQAHEEEIRDRSGNLGDFVSRVLGIFDAIATRVEDFYTQKVEPTHPISNYQSLVDDIAAKRDAVLKSMTNAQNDTSGFTCTGTNPKGQLTQYRTDMQSAKEALHAYRTSIKNLIVAVKTAIGESETPTPTAVPTATP